MRSSLIAFLLLSAAAAGCAARTVTTAADLAGRSGAPASSGLRVNDERGVMVSDILATPNKVWWALPEAFDSLGIALTLIDHPRRTLANEGFKARQKLGHTRLSNYFECGSTQVGPNADSYEMYITVMSQLDSLTADQTRLTTTVSAAAKPMAFAQDYSRCTSKGTLEKEVLAVLKARLK